MKQGIKNPVLVETALLGRGLPSLDNNLINYLWPQAEISLPYVSEGIIKQGALGEVLKARHRQDWKRIDALTLQNLSQSEVSGYLTASALIKLALPFNIVVTAGMGGITGGRISKDLVTIAAKPVWFISSGFKDVIDAKASLEYLKSHGVKVLGWKNPIYNGFIFANQGYSLDGVIEENNLKYIDFDNDKGVVIFNPVPANLKLPNTRLLELATEQMNIARENGEDFHPVVNKLLDQDTKGQSSLIQLLALISNINLALRFNAVLGG
ncbi:MAG: hypothetical protein GX333_00740 [Syntrophomonadaceae bacterium]|nr:hypothetical protein [Syntrophomonadaceae bacterium]